ncbi:MAG: hypothetical protein M3373_03500 [Gemmatimonadota bacterium]|nr:hypothetical protein [Gemmatimonadota bacterium]
MSTNWDKELAKIDKQLSSISDEELLRANAPPPAKPGVRPPPAAVGAPAPAARATRGWQVYLRVALALGLGVGILFWPHDSYAIRCGVNLFLYMASTAAITLSGMWSAVWTWRHRAPVGHIASLAVMLWGVGLAAAQVLPRVGYARPDLGVPTTWMCQ